MQTIVEVWKVCSKQQDNLISAKLWYLVKSVHIRQQIPILVTRVLFIISTIWTKGYRQKQSGRFMLYNEDATGMSILESAYGAQVCAHAPKHTHTPATFQEACQNKSFSLFATIPHLSRRELGVRRWGLRKWDLANGLGATPVCRGVFVCVHAKLFTRPVWVKPR